MPQVITGFDKYAAKVRQAEQDKRTAALQDAQEARAASTFEMAKQDRQEGKAAAAVKAKQDAEKLQLDRQKDMLGVVAGASEQLMKTTSPMPVNGAFAPLLAWLPDESMIPQVATVQSEYGGDGQPSSFVYRDATGAEVARVGLQDPAAMAAMSGKLSKDAGWLSAGISLQEDGSWAFTQVEKGTGKPLKTKVGTPQGVVDSSPDPTPSEIKQVGEYAWATGLADEIMDMIPPQLINDDFDTKDPRTMSRSIRILLGEAEPGSPEEAQLKRALIKLKDVQRRLQSGAAKQSGAEAPDPLGGMGGGSPLDGVF